MDSLMAAAAHALATGDPLLALKCVSLRDDPPALALRGIAMAQIGDLPRARLALRRAARAFGQRNPVAKARCVVAEAEIALVSRDLAAVPTMLDAARTLLEKQGDRINAAHAAILEVRRLLLVGQIHEAERLLLDIDIAALPPSLRATYHLAECGIALRRLRAQSCSRSAGSSRDGSPQSRHFRTVSRSAEHEALDDQISCPADFRWKEAIAVVRRGRGSTGIGHPCGRCMSIRSAEPGHRLAADHPPGSVFPCTFLGGKMAGRCA